MDITQLTPEEQNVIAVLRRHEPPSVEESGGNFPPIEEGPTFQATGPALPFPGSFADRLAVVEAHLNQLGQAHQFVAVADREKDAYHRIKDLERRLDLLCQALWPNQVPQVLQAQGPDAEDLS